MVLMLGAMDGEKGRECERSEGPQSSPTPRSMHSTTGCFMQPAQFDSKESKE